MIFKMEISTDNAAFCDPFTGMPNPHYLRSELVDVLRQARIAVSRCQDPNESTSDDPIRLRDHLGNTVGTAWLEEG